MKERQVLLTIESVQRFQDEEPEITKLVTQGTLAADGTDIVLSYEESELTGLEGTQTVFRISDRTVTLERVGRVQSKIIFELGQEHCSLYDTGFGALMIAVRADRIVSNLNETGGTLEVSYTIVIEEEATGTITYHITVK